jgi:hypothetical protein
MLILPTRVPIGHALAFVAEKKDWLATRLAARPSGIAFADGMVLPLLGRDHRLSHDPTGRRGVWAENGIVHVSGRPEHFARRVGDWLKRKAEDEIADRAPAMAEKIGRKIRSIRLKDTRSRWGSCSSRGDLSFSWRLVLAPAAVLDYVIGHEVAHLAQMNHSSAFWTIVRSLVAEPEAARLWLKRHGTELHLYGRP